jgi:hypothetical protein
MPTHWIGSSHNRGARRKCTDDSRFRDADRLLFHSFQEGRVLFSHLVELIDTADALISQNQRTYEGRTPLKKKKTAEYTRRNIHSDEKETEHTHTHIHTHTGAREHNVENTYQLQVRNHLCPSHEPV